jgi:hypothetical protein
MMPLAAGAGNGIEARAGRRRWGGQGWPKSTGRHGRGCPGERKGRGAFATTVTSYTGL